MSGKLLTPIEYRKKELEHKNRLLILDNCRPIIRKLISKSVVARPDDILDFMAKILSDMRGVALEDVEKSVIQKVKESGIVEDDRKYKLQKDIDDQIRYVDIDEDSPSQEGEGIRSKNKEVILPSGGFVSGLQSPASRDYDQPDQIEDDNSDDFSPRRNHSLRQRFMRRINDSFALRNLSDSEKEVMITRMKEVNFKKGDTVIKQGEQGDFLYVVDEGELKCFKKYLGETEEAFMREYNPGDTFGE